MRLWIFFFIAGILGGKLAPLPWLIKNFYLIDLVGVAVVCGVAHRIFKLKLLSRISLVAVAAAWGFAHSAPPAPSGQYEAQVLRSSGWHGGQGLLHVLIDGSIYEARGSAKVGTYGTTSWRFFEKGKFFGGVASFKAKEVAVETSAFGGWLTTIREACNNRIDAQGQQLGYWLRSILLGELLDMPNSLRRAFLVTGLMHLLVVSGSHVSLLALAVGSVLRRPFQVLYAFGILKRQAWADIQACLAIIMSALVLVYAALVGLTPPSQRAALFFVLWQLMSVFFGTMPVSQRLLLTAVSQTVLFPAGFLSESCLLSWGAYLIVLENHIEAPKSYWRQQGYALVMQMKLCILVAAVIGPLTLWGVLINAVFVPVFSAVLICAVFLILPWSLDSFTKIILEIQEIFISFVMHAARLVNSLPGADWATEILPAPIRLLIMLFAAWIWLNCCRNLSIDRVMGD